MSKIIPICLSGIFAFLPILHFIEFILWLDLPPNVPANELLRLQVQKMQYRFSLPGTQGVCVKTLAGISPDTDLLVPKMYDQQVCMGRMITVNPEQLVMEVIEVMLQSEQYTLPLYRYGLFEGTVRFKELIRFLVEDKDGHNLLLHKFNFTLETALIVMTMDNISDALEL